MISEQDKFSLLNNQAIIIQSTNFNYTINALHWLIHPIIPRASILEYLEDNQNELNTVNYEFEIVENKSGLCFSLQITSKSISHSYNENINWKDELPFAIIIKIEEYGHWLQSEDCQELIQRLLKLNVFK